MSVVAHRTTEQSRRAAGRSAASPTRSGASSRTGVPPRDGVPSQRSAPVADPVTQPRRRALTVAPPSRRRVVGAPRVLVPAGCAPPRPRLSVGWLLAVAASVCAAVVGLGLLAGSGAETVPDRTTVVHLQPGESLSELADRMAPGSDLNAVVDRIRELNGGLEGGLMPGQPVRVPTAG
ncbi:MAG TPA: hypothetical protein VNP92_25740 [Actinophytocola sp.]|nr:hypothetical protein [Actinophytocola sp.]